MEDVKEVILKLMDITSENLYLRVEECISEFGSSVILLNFYLILVVLFSFIYSSPVVYRSIFV